MRLSQASNPDCRTATTMYSRLVAGVSFWLRRGILRNHGFPRALETAFSPNTCLRACVAAQLGLNPETLRHWVRRDERAAGPSGERAVESESDKDTRIADMEREMRELRRANEILRLAAAFFAKEVDLRPPR